MPQSIKTLESPMLRKLAKLILGFRSKLTPSLLSLDNLCFVQRLVESPQRSFNSTSGLLVTQLLGSESVWHQSPGLVLICLMCTLIACVICHLFRG